MVQNGKSVMKLQIRLDKNDNYNRVKVDEGIDSVGWRNSDGDCGGASN